MCVFIKHDMVLLNTTNNFFLLLTFQVINENQRKTQNWLFLSSAIVQILLFSLGRQIHRGGSRICEKGGGGRKSKFLDTAPENNKNRPKKTKIGRKRGGGGPRPIRSPPPLDPLLIQYTLIPTLKISCILLTSTTQAILISSTMVITLS